MYLEYTDSEFGREITKHFCKGIDELRKDPRGNELLYVIKTILRDPDTHTQARNSLGLEAFTLRKQMFTKGAGSFVINFELGISVTDIYVGSDDEIHDYFEDEHSTGILLKLKRYDTAHDNGITWLTLEENEVKEYFLEDLKVLTKAWKERYDKTFDMYADERIKENKLITEETDGVIRTLVHITELDTYLNNLSK